MLILKLAGRNLLRHPMRNILIGSIIAFGVAFLFCANAVFESTTEGLRATFIGSVTGDFVIGANSEETYGIFGSEIPIVSEYEIIPAIADFVSVSSVLNQNKRVTRWTPLVSAAAQVNVGGYAVKAPVFGVDPSTYFSVCADITILSGNIEDLLRKGVFLNEHFVRTAELSLGRKLEPWEPVVFTIYTKGSFRARKGYFAGVYRYPAPTEALNRVVLVDPVIARTLCNYTLGYALADSDQKTEQETAVELDSLFDSVNDIADEKGEKISLSKIEEDLADTAARDTLIMTDEAAWSFAIARVLPGENPRAAREDVTHNLKEKKVDARVIDWRTAAGSSALMIFAIRSAFNVGIGFLILGAALVVMNSLVISVLERTNEIGAMRALGAERKFIRQLFIIETTILTAIAAVVGIIIGATVSTCFARSGIPITNPLLMSLFGGDRIRPIFGAWSILSHMIGVLLIGSVAWIYPVSLALRIEPIAALAER